MGGGHVSRPDFGMPQPDPAYPLTEFYQLLQRTLDRTGSFALPALYACLQAPARLQLLYSSLHVLPDGTPTALLLTEACTRTVTAVQLLPPVVWEDPLPPLPDVPAALTVQLTMQDVLDIDTDPAALGRRLAEDPAGKCWRSHPRAETFLAERVALLQRVYR